MDAELLCRIRHACVQPGFYALLRLLDELELFLCGTDSIGGHCLVLSKKKSEKRKTTIDYKIPSYVYPSPSHQSHSVNSSTYTEVASVCIGITLIVLDVFIERVKSPTPELSHFPPKDEIRQPVGRDTVLGGIHFEGEPAREDLPCSGLSYLSD